MARTCIVFGLMLCGLTITGLVVFPAKHPVQFIPMMLGIPILFCGVVGLNPHRRNAALRFAMTIAAVGGLTGATRILFWITRMRGDDSVNYFALKVVSVMTGLCAVFALLCMISLIRARKRRLANEIAASRDGTSGGSIHPT